MRQLRAVAHRIRPLVEVGKRGLSQTVVEELLRALADHELVKIRVTVGDRTNRDKLVSEMCNVSGAVLVQRVGNVATLFLENPNVDLKKSNFWRSAHE